MSGDYIIGADIGGTNIRIGTSDGSGGLLFFHKTASKEVFTGRDSVKNLTGLMKEYIKSLPEGKIGALAAGLPSTLNKARDTVLQTPNLLGLDNIPLKKILEEALGTKVFLEKDVNLRYCHDRRELNLDRSGVHVGIYVGTGIGNAIFIEGSPLTGRDGSAGEIGHIPLVSGGMACGCGNSGCAECYAGGKYLAGLMEQEYPGEPISEVFLRHPDSPKLVQFIEDIARVAATEINILNPGTIVLGGGVLNMQGFPREQLIERIRSHTRKPYPERSLEIYFSHDAVENGVKGAIEYARERL